MARNTVSNVESCCSIQIHLPLHCNAQKSAPIGSPSIDDIVCSYAIRGPAVWESLACKTTTGSSSSLSPYLIFSRKKRLGVAKVVVSRHDQYQPAK